LKPVFPRALKPYNIHPETKRNLLKVVLVGAYPPPYGGVQVHLEQLERFLEGRGHTCFIINMGKNKTLKSSKLVSPRYGFQVAYYLFKRRDHVCHLHFGGILHWRLLLLALFSNLLFLKKCIITIHSGGLPVWGHPKNLLKKFLLKLSFARCRAVICVNQDIANYFQKLGVKPEKIQVISPFVFENIPANNLLPEIIGSFISRKKPLLCNIGLLEPEYDLDLLLRVFKRFLKEKPEAGLIMIGSGSLHYKLQKMISELDLQEKVFLTGDLSHKDTLKVLGMSDCYVRASRYDGDCISLKEAIQLGIPSIASDTGLRPKESILFPIGDEEALLKCLTVAIASSFKGNENRKQKDFSNLLLIEEILRGAQFKEKTPGDSPEKKFFPMFILKVKNLQKILKKE
jgi:glycosyltransferase involved in cell wall biosynthesis